MGGVAVRRWVGADLGAAGNDVAQCDAMATAVMVAEQDSAKWFGQPELAGYQVFAVNRHEQSAWNI